MLETSPGFESSPITDWDVRVGRLAGRQPATLSTSRELSVSRQNCTLQVLAAGPASWSMPSLHDHASTSDRRRQPCRHFCKLCEECSVGTTDISRCSMHPNPPNCPSNERPTNVGP